MNTKKLIEAILEYLVNMPKAQEANIKFSDIAAKGRDPIVGTIRRVAGFVYVESLGYDKNDLCPYFGKCTPENVYSLLKSVKNLINENSDDGKRLKELADGTLAALVKQFGSLDEIKYKSEEDAKPAGSKPAGSGGRQKRKYTRHVQKDDSSKVTPEAFCAGIEKAGGYLLLSSLKKPGVTVEALADAFKMKKSDVEHAVCEAIIVERDGNEIPKALLDLVESASRLKLL